MKRNGKYHPVNAYTKWMKMFSEDLKRKRLHNQNNYRRANIGKYFSDLKSYS